MENEELQSPGPEARVPEGQAYQNWQYEQDDPTEIIQPPAGDPPRLFLPLPSPPAQGAGQLPAHPTQRDNVPHMPEAPGQHPRQDSGGAPGYGQGREYQHVDAPQLSQSAEQALQERLQMLREERIRRQQRPVGPEAKIVFPLNGDRLKAFSVNDVVSKLSLRLHVPQQPADEAAPPDTSRVTPVLPLLQQSPLLSLPAKPVSEGGALPVRSVSEGGTPRAAALPSLSSELAQEPLVDFVVDEPVETAEKAQDTGGIQRARIGRAALLLTGAFVISRMLGLLRTVLFAFVFGTSTISDAYLQAFLVPDLIFYIVAGGALSSAFIPVFTNYVTREGDEKTAWHITSSALNLALAVMSGLALLVIIFARLLVPLYNPGISDPRQLDLIAALTRIMLLQSVTLGAGVIVTSVLNARQDFRLPALGTVVYNIGLIIGLLPGTLFALVGRHNDLFAVYAATWGVVLGALLQVGIQLPGLLKVGMRYSPAFDWRHPGVLQIARQMVPRVINAAMLYVSIFVDRGLIQLLVIILGIVGVDGLITQYYQAFQLVLLPLGIFGMSVSTAAFPTLAENVARGRLDRVRTTILETMRSILFLAIPSSVGLIVLAFPIIQVLLQHGRYGLQEALSTSVPLSFFALGLTGFAAVEILTRSFYAMRDSITPVMVSVAQFVFKIVLSLVLINVVVWGPQWSLGALAFSTSLAGLLEAGVMFWLLHQRLGDLQPRATALFVLRVLVAALAMGLCLLVVRAILDRVFDTTLPLLQIGGTILALCKLLLELFVGVFVFVRAARFLSIEELGPVKRILDRLKLSWI